MREEAARAIEQVEGGAAAGQFTARARFDPARPFFQGHFPGRPVVPGLLLIELVRTAAERFTGERWDLSSAEKAKFSSPVAPGESIVVEGVLARVDGNCRVKATVRTERAVAATMTLVLITRAT